MRKSSLEIKDDPQAKIRPRFSGKIAYTPAKYKKIENVTRQKLKIAFREDPYSTAITVSVRFGIKKPKSVKRKYPSVKSDLDNYVKQVFDCGNGILWEDDALIVGMFAEKYYSEEGVINIEIAELK